MKPNRPSKPAARAAQEAQAPAPPPQDRRPGVPLRLGSLNLVCLIGRLCMDSELKYTPAGAAVLSFRLAVNHAWKDKASGEWKQEASFFTVNVWGQSAERLSESTGKGTAVLVQGQLRSRSWETKEGDKRSVVEVTAGRVQVLDKSETETAPDNIEPGMF